MTTTRQLSVFLENKAGRLQEALEILGNGNVNLTALTIADTTEFGIARLIVSDPEQGHELLKSQGFSVNLTEVITLALPHEPGSLAAMLKLFAEEKMSVEYAYAFCLGEKAVIVLRTDNYPKAFEIIKRNQLAIIDENEIRNL